MKLAVNVTVEDTTYPEGTDTSKVKNREHRKVLEANEDFGKAPEESDQSAGASQFDSMDLAQLKAAVDERNAAVTDESQKISVDSENKGDYVEALEAFDRNHPTPAT